jgi:hypothetical protein
VVSDPAIGEKRARLPKNHALVLEVVRSQGAGVLLTLNGVCAQCRAEEKI